MKHWLSCLQCHSCAMYFSCSPAKDLIKENALETSRTTKWGASRMTVIHKPHAYINTDEWKWKKEYTDTVSERCHLVWIYKGHDKSDLNTSSSSVKDILWDTIVLFQNQCRTWCRKKSDEKYSMQQRYQAIIILSMPQEQRPLLKVLMNLRESKSQCLLTNTV